MQTTAYELPRPPRRLGPSVPIPRLHCMPLGLGLKQRVITSGSSWTPLSLGTKLAAWYEAFLGGSATSATDLSTNGQNLAPGGASPTYHNGGSGASWWDYSGSSSALLHGGSFNLSQPYQVIAVAWLTSTPSGSQYLYDFAPGNTGAANFQASTSLLMYAGSANTCSVTPSTGAWFVTEAQWNGASSQQTLNAGTPSTGNPGTAHPSAAGFFMGNVGNGGSNAAPVRIGEIVIANALLSVGEESSLQAYLSAKWGIA